MVANKKKGEEKVKQREGAEGMRVEYTRSKRKNRVNEGFSLFTINGKILSHPMVPGLSSKASLTSSFESPQDLCKQLFSPLFLPPQAELSSYASCNLPRVVLLAGMDV